MIALLMTPEQLPSRFSGEDGEAEPRRPSPALPDARLPSPQWLAAAVRRRVQAHRAARRASSPAAW